MKTEIRKTTSDVHNPFGDARSNRAHWRSPLEKSVIPAGFRYRVERDDNGLITVSNAGSTRYGAHVYGEKGTKLAAILEGMSEPDEETIDSVLAMSGFGGDSVLTMVVCALKITPHDLARIISNDDDCDERARERLAHLVNTSKCPRCQKNPARLDEPTRTMTAMCPACIAADCTKCGRPADDHDAEIDNDCPRQPGRDFVEDVDAEHDEVEAGARAALSDEADNLDMSAAVLDRIYNMLRRHYGDV